MTPGDCALILLGASHLGTQGLLGDAGAGHVTKAWLDGFIDGAVLPLIPR